MINEKNELVMELMNEDGVDNFLRMSFVYNVKLRGSERRKGLCLGKNGRGNFEVLMNYSENDRVKLPRIYSFDNYSYEGNSVDVPVLKGPRILNSEDLSSPYWIKTLERLKNGNRR